MKFANLSSNWKNQALKMIICTYQDRVNEIAKSENVESWKITKSSQEVKDAKEEWNFEVETDEVTGKQYLSRI
mgnify:FL=1